MLILPYVAPALVSLVWLYHFFKNRRNYTKGYSNMLVASYITKLGFLWVSGIAQGSQAVLYFIGFTALVFMCWSALMASEPRRSWGEIWEYPRFPIDYDVNSFASRFMYYVTYDIVAIILVTTPHLYILFR